MKNFIHYLRCMYAFRNYKHTKDKYHNYYYWYRYLALFELQTYFNKFRFWKHKEDVPF